MATLAPALVRARGELNSRWPNRDRRTDGWIGDTSHATSGRPENGGSDHNPNRRGVVDALDIDVDGIDCPAVVALMTRHPSTNYVIWNRGIWSRSRGFKKATYTGSNPHTDHIHLSILQTVAAENNTTPWGISTAAPGTSPGGGGAASWPQTLVNSLPVLEQAAGERQPVRKLQALLNAVTGSTLNTDGVFGPVTGAAVHAFQKSQNLTVDGIVGPKTWGALAGTLPTIRKDASGPAVVRLQHLLNVAGAALEPDGDFGALTHVAVREYQARMSLTVDGIVGPNTWTALFTR